MNHRFWMTKIGLLLFLVAMEIQNCSNLRPRKIRFAGCENVHTKPLAVFLTCANRRGDCEVRKGNSHNLRFFFRPKINSTDVESYAAWNTWFHIPLPRQDREGCKFLHKKCPLKANKLTSFTYKMKVDSFWPSDTFPVIWTLTDKKTEEEVVCLKFKIVIK